MVHNGYSNCKTLKLTKVSGTNPKSADPKITPKGALTYPIKYMVQALSCYVTDVQGGIYCGYVEH